MQQNRYLHKAQSSIETQVSSHVKKWETAHKQVQPLQKHKYKNRLSICSSFAYA